MKVFYNADIFQVEKGFTRGWLGVSGDRISCMGQGKPPEGTQNSEAPNGLPVDLRGHRVLPGLIDIHTHGNSGHDFSDGKVEGLHKMGKYLASHGITSFAPTSMTLPYEKLDTAFRTAAEYRDTRAADEARAAGIHMEGPYFSEKKKGAQNSDYLKLPDIEGFFDLQEGCGHLIRIVDIAPELESSIDFIKAVVSGGCLVSVAHTDALYGDAIRAFDAGASHVTHLFNAMRPIHHREPGIIGAACEKENVTVELICDGLHVHPSVIRMAFRLFPGRVCLISDALRCCGMPDGMYELGGQQVRLENGQARLLDGTIAGAASNLFDDMVNAIHFGIPAEEAIRAATIIPAGEIGADSYTGSLEEGKMADFIVCDKEWNLKQVYLGGTKIRPEEG